MFRIQDKNAALSAELGKDLNSALALLRKHEGFENDLVALEVQLQILVEDSVKLSAKYPGDNAKEITAEQETVVKSWNTLKERSAIRSDQLAASYDLQNFLSQVRDLMSWASNLRATLQAEEHVSDAAGATALKIQHDAIYGEIEAREEKFRHLNELSDSMVQTGHYAATEVEEKCTALLDERQRLHVAWQNKKTLLEQKIDLYCFLRDAKQIDNISSSQEAALSSSDFGQTVEVVQDQVKRHDAFEKLIQTQDEKVAILQDHGRKLVQQHHYDSANIQKTLNDVIEHRQNVKELCNVRRLKLENALLYVQFVRDCAEAEAWIIEKQKKLESDANSFNDVSNMEDKIKKLQKHQAFQAEITANEGRIREIKDKGNQLVAKRHESSNEIKDEMNKLIESWNALLNEVATRGRGLEEAQDILEFNNQLEKIEAWIRDKEMMIQASDTGRDLEHCNALRRKLDDVDSDMRVDEERIKSINVLADKLMSQEKSENQSKTVEQRRSNFNSKWKSLEGALNNYRGTLDGAYEIHVFNRAVDDTAERIAEKSLAMSVDDTGRDLNAVELLKRKQDALLRDMTAIKQKISEHEAQAQKLCKKYPDSQPIINAKLDELQKMWTNLEELSVKRKDTLENGYTIQKFVSDVRELELWTNEIIKKMNSSPSPITINECVQQIQLHDERKAEINGRDKIFKNLQQHGEELIKFNDNETLRDSLQNLSELNVTLHQAWQDKSKRLNDAHQLQLFKEQSDQIDLWLANKEAFLNNDDLGDTFTAVEILIKKHNEFEKLLKNTNRCDELNKFASKILASEPYETESIKQKLSAISQRQKSLLKSSDARKEKLQESLQLQQFQRNLYEVERWLNQKLQVALDENYRDFSNLQNKIQKHSVFDAELSANSNRVSKVIAEGVQLIDAKHYASDDIYSQIDILESDWGKLREMSRDKKQKLAEAYDALIFGRSLDEFNSWMEEIETHLSSDDYGKDLASCNNLLKKHDILEQDMTNHNDLCESMTEQDNNFMKRNHFMKDDIHERCMNTVRRYHSLNEPMGIRRDNLEDSLTLHQFMRDSDDEIFWLNDKLLLAESKDLGNNLTAVQSLQKKHQALEGEILSQEPIIMSLVKRGQQMINDNHYAGEKIDAQLQLLQNKLHQLRNLANIRKLRLLDAVESQMFYAEINESELWIKERRPILISHDYGKDEDSVQSLQKKLDILQREIVAFKPTFEKIQKLAESLLERSHFDSEKIQAKNEKIQNMFIEVQELAEVRESKLIETKKLYQFLREVEDLHEWINEQMAIAASEEYGTDVEHVEQLTLNFESFVTNLNANESRVTSCLNRGEQLLSENNPQKQEITIKHEETKQLWEELKDLVTARQEALAGAKQVHVYDRIAEETISSINEKITDLLSEDYGQDLETIQALVRKHDSFEIELVAIKEQVETVIADANKLAETFPDAKDHIEVKRDETNEAWIELQEKSQQRKGKLMQAGQLQAYFDEYRDLMAWINEMLAKITAPDLAKDVSGAEMLITKIKEHQTEVESRHDAFEKFYKDGQKLIDQKHFLSNEVQDKIAILEQRKSLLDATLVRRKELYELNIDTQQFLREAEILENWLISREIQLKDVKLGDSITQVEDLIRKHDDFEKTVAAQEEKFVGLKRITLLEKLFKKQLEEEEAARRIEKERIEKERIEALKQKEVQRITEERRRNEKQIDTNGFSQMEKSPIFSKSQIPPSQTQQQQLVQQDLLIDANKSVDSLSGGSVQKSNSFAIMIGDRLRRGSEGNIKRAESMKTVPKQPKRTPSFTTRKRANSFKKNAKGSSNSETSNLPPVEIQGMLDRKHELQSGGKKSPVRSWKPFHTVLCGQILCFFKDEVDFAQNKAASAPVSILNAKCSQAEDYTKKKNVFRLTLPDGSEFLFLAASKEEMTDWISKIAFHASLPPNLQLMSYDESVKVIIVVYLFTSMNFLLTVFQFLFFVAKFKFVRY